MITSVCTCLGENVWYHDRMNIVVSGPCTMVPYMVLFMGKSLHKVPQGTILVPYSLTSNTIMCNMWLYITLVSP